MRTLLLCLLLGSCVASAQQNVRTETGTLSQASFRIDIPAQWNGDLIIYCRGYSSTPILVKAGPPSAIVASWVGAGMAVAQSGLSHGPWAIASGVNDISALRKHFIAKNGHPTHIYILGESMGGYLAMASLEQHPRYYDGSLVTCAPLVSPVWFMGRRVFDLRVVFDYYFPGVFPSLDTPASADVKLPSPSAIENMLNQNHDASENLLLYSGIHTNKELANTVAFFTVMLHQLALEVGDRPFGNLNIVYEGTKDDDKLNEGVHRYDPVKMSEARLTQLLGPTGRLQHPLLSLQTTYDPIIPGWVVNRYQTEVDIAGKQDMFSQMYVEGSGHCAIPAREVAKGLDTLKKWVVQKQPPSHQGHEIR